jgi:serine/threonine protein kinase
MLVRVTYQFFMFTAIRIGQQIGEGSFGKVFEALDREGNSLVLKQVESSTSQCEELAQSEIECLKALKQVRNVPQYLDSCVLGSQHFILMSRIPGIPLEEFLLGSNLSIQHRIEVAYYLLYTLAPTLRDTGHVCCHRDVNSRNILIQPDRSGAGLIDFGLAVEKNAWWQYMWRELPPGGDPRYWPCCAWRMVLNGWRDVSRTELGEEQYKDKLDLHSFALTLVECIVSGSEDSVHELSPLRKAFSNYMHFATQCANIFVTCSRTRGNWDQAKTDLRSIEVLNTTRSNLKRIKYAIKSVRDTHPIFPIIERMLCVDESTISGSWSYVLSKLSSISTTTSLLRFHY